MTCDGDPAKSVASAVELKRLNKIAEDTEMEYLGHQFWFILWLRLQAKVNIKKKKQRNNDYLTLSQTLFFKQFVATNSQTIAYHLGLAAS